MCVRVKGGWVVQGEGSCACTVEAQRKSGTRLLRGATAKLLYGRDARGNGTAFTTARGRGVSGRGRPSRTIPGSHACSHAQLSPPTAGGRVSKRRFGWLTASVRPRPCLADKSLVFTSSQLMHIFYLITSTYGEILKTFWYQFKKMVDTFLEQQFK